MLLRSMVGAITSLAALSMQGAAPSQLERVVWRHELTEAVAGSVNRGGRHGPDGWTLVAPRAFCRSSYPGLRRAMAPWRCGSEGWTGPNSLGRWVPARRSIFSMRSPTRRATTMWREAGRLPMPCGHCAPGRLSKARRYGPHLKVLWASRGAKRTPGSDYHERLLPFPEARPGRRSSGSSSGSNGARRPDSCGSSSRDGRRSSASAGAAIRCVTSSSAGRRIRGLSGATFRQLEVLQLASGRSVTSHHPVWAQDEMKPAENFLAQMEHRISVYSNTR